MLENQTIESFKYRKIRKNEENRTNYALKHQEKTRKFQCNYILKSLETKAFRKIYLQKQTKQQLYIEKQREPRQLCNHKAEKQPGP